MSWDLTQEYDAESWGRFMQHAAEFGVEIRYLEPEELSDRRAPRVSYLYRFFEDSHLFCDMPSSCTPYTVMRLRRVERTCRQLKIPCPKWPITM